MRFNVLTLFPEFFSGVLQSSLFGKAVEQGLVDVQLIQLRNFTQDKHNRVDDKPFGGGPGMLMQVEPIDLALQSLGSSRGRVLLTDARGRQLTTQWSQELAREETVTIICGNYEGVDYRVNEQLIDDEVSLGPFITNGGESVAVVLMEAVARFLPGFMSKEESYREESFDGTDLVEYPQYTRPANYRGWQVPEVLTSGNHRAIEEWRRKKREELSERRDKSGPAHLKED